MSEEQLITTPCTFGENGNFVLERELGRGGMGGVYMGRDKMLDRPVAVKVMLREYGSDAEFVERFKREAQAAARLIHPNIAQIYSYGISDGMPYIAMELVAGGSLDQVMSNFGGKTDVPRVMKICEQVAQALRCAADQGLVHGDVKPENVLLDANGNAKLVDFGLAAMQKDTDEIWGTPYYIAPEKVKKQAVDYRADMYSLGGTIYHALTGVAPFEGDDAAAVVRKRFEGAPRKPSELRSGLSPQIDALVMRMLALDPADRYPSFEALLADFKNVMTTGLSATQPVPAAQGAAASRPTARVGGRKLMLKRRRVAVSSAADAADEPDVDAEPSNEDVGEEETSRRGGVKLRRKGVKRRMPTSDYDDEEEGEEGGMGGKVALVIGGIIGVVLLVVGGLYLAIHHNAAKNEQETAARIEKGIRDSGESLEGSLAAVQKLDDDIAEMISENRKACDKVGVEMKKELVGSCPDEIIAALRPPEPAELVAAKREFEKGPEQPAAAAAPAAAKPQADAKPADAKPADASKKPADAKDDAARQADADAADEAAAAKPGAVVSSSGTASMTVSEKHVESVKKTVNNETVVDESSVKETVVKVEMSSYAADGVKKFQDLWGKVYAAETGAWKLRSRIKALAADIDTARRVSGHTEAEMKRMAAATMEIKGRYDSIVASEEMTNLKKAKGLFVNPKGTSAAQKVVKDLHKKLAAEKARVEKEQKAKAAEEARKAAEEKKAADAAKRVEDELALVNDEFQKMCVSGDIRRLDWKTANRKMDDLKKRVNEDGTPALTTAEGQIALLDAKKRISMMQSVQNTLRKNLKNYKFTARPRSSDKKAKHLYNMVVVSMDDKVLVVKPAVGSNSQKREIRWEVFYRDYNTNLGEVLNKFVLKGNENANPKLTPKEHADALFGVALLMRIVFADNPDSAKYGEDMVKAALKVLPSYLSLAKKFFPDLNYEQIEKEAESKQL